ncbi:MAG: TonB-dependent receptor [Flavobacteriaceae bacterium]|jgi:outer membrane cobalamin receptor|nr:TonB-dependent receptor [Flavobacteriaceae bacterium]
MIHKHKNIKLLLTQIFSILTLILFSQEQKERKDSTKITELQEIITIGKRENKGIISYQELSGKELQNLTGASSVSDALRYFSGIQLKDYGGVGGMKTVNIRGMGSQHVGVFYDGIQLGNAQNGTVDLGKFSLDNMESVSLYNGQKSQIFQSAKDFGSAGSIYMTTKKPKFENDKRTNLSANYRSGSFALINPSVLWEQKLSENINLSLNTEYINSNGKYKFRHRKDHWDTIGIRQNGNISAFRVEVGLFGKLNKGTWNLKGYYYDSERGIPGAIVKNVFNSSSKQWDRNFFLQGSFEKEITHKYKILVNAKYANDYTHFYRLVLDYIQGSLVQSDFLDNTFKQEEFYISTAQQYSLFSFWDIALSADYQYNTMDANLKLFVYPERNTELVALASNIRFNRFKFQTSILGTFVQEDVKNDERAAPSPDKQEFTPTVFLNYELFKNRELNIHAFYKRIFRMPTFNDLYYTDLGNSLLKPEYTAQYDIGIEYNKDFKSGSLRNINLVLDAYYNEVKDKIIAYPKGQQFRWTMINMGEVLIRGIDVSARSSWSLSKNLSLNTRLSYTYEKAQNLTMEYKDQIPYIPWHSGSFLINTAYKDWNLNYSFIYTGERYNSPENSPNNYVKAWFSHDLLISKEIPLDKLKLKVALEVNNILNRNYDIVLNYPMPGRNYRISVQMNI